MADTSAEADIRGIDIDKLARGFADEANILKKFVRNTKTKAREIRSYTKTSGFLDTPITTDTAGTLMSNVAAKARPFVIEQSWTRNTNYVKKFFVESPWLSIEDIKDNDVDVLGTNVRDIVRGVARKEDLRIFSVLFNAAAATPTLPLTNGAVTVQTTAATGTGWDDSVSGNPISDLMIGQQKIRAEGYNPMKAVIGLNSVEHRLLLDYIINVKGSSIPQFAAEKVKSGAVMEILGLNVLVSEHFTTDWVYMWIPAVTGVWKTFMPLTTAIVDEPGIGKKIRCWSEGEMVMTDPNSCHVTSDTIT